ncbi:hypothetical protein JD844_016209 [Phrynosoma platyrhinos]|uniref:TFIIS N-terminal domain-containing protein n=1 Tax=Phrynosoma platyrhinos TaxID=52577 RepID=A0ABQ7SK26_PHRPL|nr:hypothetical protein JD844_016209 [Phrynosoma platyrhinos]
MSTEDEIIRIAKKMDKMVQKKNAVQVGRDFGTNFDIHSFCLEQQNEVPVGFLGRRVQAGALDLLKELKNMPMTLELLQSTRIGMSVNAIRKQSTDEEVTSLAKSLIKSWKKLLDGPSNDKDSEDKKKEAASSSQNSPEAREERVRKADDYIAIGADEEELGSQIEEDILS